MHTYRATTRWHRTSSDFTYDTYNRAHEVTFPGGITVPWSSAPEFRGEPERVNPEEAFVAALSTCHMLTFLAIAARRLGFGPVTAIDFDPDSVAATARAARANMVDAVDVRRATIGEDPLPVAPVLLANITLEVLRVLAAQLAAAPAGGDRVRHAVLSGLREHEVDDAVAAFAPLGLAEAERLAEDAWASVRLRA